MADDVLGFRDKIVIKNRAWIVQEYDAISTPGLIYYSLKPTTINKETLIENHGKDVYVEKFEQPVVNVVDNPIRTNDIISISANVQTTIKTEDGYFKVNNKNVKILKRVKNSVTFSIPFGVQEVEVEIKEKGDIVTRQYRVV